MSTRLTVLDNGMRVVTDAMETVETASLGVWVEAGTRHETPQVNGISHLLEHMAFKGTRRRDARAIAEEIEAVGGQMNAYTSRENTAYYAKVLKEDVGLALDVIADILQNSVMDPEELARERSVIVQEIRQANDTPDDIIFDHFQETAFPDQAIGRPVLGTEHLVETMPRESILAYMRDHYSPSRLVLSAAGRVNHVEIVNMAEAAFTDLTAGPSEAFDPLVYKGGDYRESRNLDQVQFVLGLEGAAYDSPDYYPMTILTTILGGGMSSRLFQEVREKRGLAYSIYAFASSYVDGGVFGIHAGTGAGELEELVPVIADALNGMRHGVTETEIARARAQIKSSILMALESTSARCEQRARQTMIYGAPQDYRDVIDKVEAVDAAAVQRAAERLVATPLTLAALGPVADLESHEAFRARLG